MAVPAHRAAASKRILEQNAGSIAKMATEFELPDDLKERIGALLNGLSWPEGAVWRISFHSAHLSPDLEVVANMRAIAR